MRRLTRRTLLGIGTPSEDCTWYEVPYIYVTRVGLHFANDAGGHNAHWYDLQHPLERYSAGDRRCVFFVKQVLRGLRLVFTGRMSADD